MGRHISPVASYCVHESPRRVHEQAWRRHGASAKGQCRAAFVCHCSIHQQQVGYRTMMALSAGKEATPKSLIVTWTPDLLFACLSTTGCAFLFNDSLIISAPQLMWSTSLQFQDISLSALGVISHSEHITASCQLACSPIVTAPMCMCTCCLASWCPM